MKYFCLLFLTCAFALAACSGDNGANRASTPSNSVRPAEAPLPDAKIDEMASGRKVYSENCKACHKEDGTGGEIEFEGKKLKPDDLTSAKIKGFTDEKIIGYIMKGVEDEGMPAFEGRLSEGEMRDVVKFIRVELQKVATAKPKG